MHKIWLVFSCFDDAVFIKRETETLFAQQNSKTEKIELCNIVIIKYHKLALSCYFNDTTAVGH